MTGTAQHCKSNTYAIVRRGISGFLLYTTRNRFQTKLLYRCLPPYSLEIPIANAKNYVSCTHTLCSKREIFLKIYHNSTCGVFKYL